MSKICVFENFVDAVKEELDKREISYQVTEVVKTNDQLLTGIVVDNGRRIRPNVYLENFFEEYMKDKKMPIQEVCDHILKLASAPVPNDTIMEFVEDFENYQKIKGNLRIALCNKARSGEFLADKPWFPVLDLAAYAIVPMGANASITINKEHLRLWGVSKDTLFTDAEKNTKGIIMNMKDVVLETFLEEIPEEDREIARLMLDGGAETPFIMNVVSNRERLKGAYSIFAENLLKNMAEDSGVDSLYVIPSSIHECIVVPMQEAIGPEYVYSMIGEVNATVIAENEFLSDNLYIYRLEDNSLSIYGGTETEKVIL